MIPRHQEASIRNLMSIYPVVAITGPRQSGKTTLAKYLRPDLPYVSFENLDTRSYAHADPRAFLNNYEQGAIFDEIQRVPEILSYLQEKIDSNRIPGKFIITGSQNFSLAHHISQSLAGRVGTASLLPFSLNEISETSVFDAIFNGGYPMLHAQKVSPLIFYPNYIQTYLERDVRQIQNVENLGTFQTFLKLCAGRVGQLINMSSLAMDAGISPTTAKKWLNLLEASYIIFMLHPYHENFNKRLTKMPKLYFYDTGLACSLLGLEASSQIESHYLKGALFENLIILEILKGRLNRGLPHNLTFWRDKTGHEIDVIAEWGGSIHAMEIKLGSTLQETYLKNLKYFKTLAEGKKTITSYLLYTGTQTGAYLSTKLIPFSLFEDLFEL